MHLSIIIPTYQRYSELERLLISISNCNLSGLVTEILVVDNLEDSRTNKITEKFSLIKYLCSHQIGVNRARNLGLESATGDIVLFFDDDCYIKDVELIKKHYNFHVNNRNCTGLGGIYLPDEESTIFGLAHWEGMMNWLIDVVNLENTYRLIGGHASYKRQAIKDVRFDESIVYGSAEVGFNQFLFEQDHQLCLRTDLGLYHSFNMSKIEMENKCAQQARNYAKLFHEKKYSDLKPLDKAGNPLKDTKFITDILQRTPHFESFYQIKKSRIEVFWKNFTVSN